MINEEDILNRTVESIAQSLRVTSKAQRTRIDVSESWIMECARNIAAALHVDVFDDIENAGFAAGFSSAIEGPPVSRGHVCGYCGSKEPLTLEPRVGSDRPAYPYCPDCGGV